MMASEAVTQVNIFEHDRDGSQHAVPVRLSYHKIKQPGVIDEALHAVAELPVRATACGKWPGHKAAGKRHQNVRPAQL